MPDVPGDQGLSGAQGGGGNPEVVLAMESLLRSFRNHQGSRLSLLLEQVRDLVGLQGPAVDAEFVEHAAEEA